MRTPTNPSRLAVEALEGRFLLAGNVLAAFQGGHLIVRGDVADNQVQIAQLTGGALRVLGNTGTTVNGQAFFDTAGNVKDVKIRMEQGGADQFMIQGGLDLPGDLQVRLGDGQVLIEGSDAPVTIGKDLRIRTGARSDVTLRNEVHVLGKTAIDSGGTVTVVSANATLPNFAAAKFSNSLKITNPYFPLVAGAKYTYTVDEAGTMTETIVVEVSPTPVTILGIETREVRDRVYRTDGQLKEDTLDWYAQDDVGNVWYLGEQVTNYNYDAQGNFLGTTSGGSWEAGKNGAVAGVIMEADPHIGDRYFQEFNKNDVLDQAAVLARGETMTVPLGTFSNVLRTRDTSVQEPAGVKDKLFAPGLGSIEEIAYDHLTGEVTETTRLISAEVNGKTTTEVVSPTGFKGTNALGRVVGRVQLDKAVTLDAGDAVIVIQTKFGANAAIESDSDVGVTDSTFAGRALIDAEGTVGLSNVTAQRQFQIESEKDVYIFNSQFRGETTIDFGAGDNSLVIAGSTFTSLEADGGAGQNAFDDRGGNVFGELSLTGF